ncbi:hypothetical protein MZ018_04465 [Shewanella sp. JNE10-2]|uniref:hypothetical protein n=1 Tax=unclassified Shewanella TaxID=196818 RepID=UPI0020031C04|nr:MULTISPECIES: hypothetical protein [unclassified Shewanella]MCK7630992.1 hypothetical protein [Shewanella sp. JNE9-1]MCK7646245.1 hypothetical protein [Shewanella sp. JNE3-1]MCK7654200.1 hypothetical protein [Shewanella sp. JNE4-1]UPO28051.1 hypothetical protein MZ018_04465 [Shewanella sp. JNE10-2]UPO35258.1 hypothetical protein MZ097_20130 [Shewanella sp. JNE7]
MNTEHLYHVNFPDKHKVQKVDIVKLYHEQQFNELDAVVVCKDKVGNVSATFGQSNWNCFAFSRRKRKTTLNFSELDTSPELQRELKLFTFGWLFNLSPKGKKASMFSTVESRFCKLKVVYLFLVQENLKSIAALSSPIIRQKFDDYLTNMDYSQGSLELVFVAINKVIENIGWHKVGLGIKPIESKHKSKRLSTKQAQQTLVIPEHLCHAIYGKAIALVEEAFSLAPLIADTEIALQNNYLEGKRIVKSKIDAGFVFSFMEADGGINNQKFASSIIDNQPHNPVELINPLANKLPNIPLKNANQFKRYLGQLITASYIICGGFSGMRDSELDKLTSSSYYQDSLNGRVHHMLQSHTFKLGEKRETWVTAAISKVAIHLMSILTEKWRTEVQYPDVKYANSLWVNQDARSKQPKVIDNWNDRLKRFCEHFDFNVTEEDYQECLNSNPRSLQKIEKTVVIGKPWPMSTHQFRRTLAFYCIKNRLGTMVALKQQFKHLYLSMTEWYSNGGKLASLRDLKVDVKIQQALDEINAEMTTNKIFKQWHSDEILSGSHGKAIMKMRDDIPTIYSSWDIIFYAVKNGKLTLHGTLHSYCKSGYDCDMDGVIAPQFCVDCRSGSSIIDKQQAKWWQKKHRSLSAYMALGEDISVTERSHYITQIRAAENVMKDFGLEFTTFEAELALKEI